MFESLRAAVLKNPEDVHSLQVYADALLEADAPGSELIRASINATEPIGVEPEHHRLLMGRVAPAVSSMTIFRGMPWSASRLRLPPSKFARIIGHPDWETVRSIHFEEGRQSGVQGPTRSSRSRTR